MKQFTVRDVPPEIEGKIIKEAEEKGISLNQAIISLLERAVRINWSIRKARIVYSDLDHLYGIWDEDDWKDFERSITLQRRISSAKG